MGAISLLHAAMLLQAAAALNVSVVPAYFRSQKERNFFKRYGKWQIDERRCDRFVRNRAYDKSCQRLDPKPSGPARKLPGKRERAARDRHRHAIDATTR